MVSQFLEAIVDIKLLTHSTPAINFSAYTCDDLCQELETIFHDLVKGVKIIIGGAELLLEGLRQ